MSQSTSEVLNYFLAPDKKVALVKKITEKTREGKIVWQKAANGFAAYIPGKLKLVFIEAPFSLISTPRWVVFVVRDDADNEILKVDNNTTALPASKSTAGVRDDKTSALLAGLMALSGDPVVTAVTDLHNLILGQRTKGGIERAIDLLDTI
jgi:hypothetical protein